MAPVDQEKLKALQAKTAANKVGGKRVVKSRPTTKVSAVDDKRVKTAIAKLGARDVPGIDEVNMFKKDGTVLNFTNPKLYAAIQNNTFGITGVPQKKNLADMLPGVISQIGYEGLEQLKDLYSAAASGEDFNEPVPDLVSN